MRNVQFSCAIERVLPFRENFRESRNLLAIMAAWPRTPTEEHTPTRTHVKSRTDYTRNPQTSEKQKGVMRNNSPTWCCGHHIATTLVLSQLGGPLVAWSIAGITRCIWATTAVVSLPPEFTRVARKKFRSWRVDQPLQCCPNFNSDTNRFTFSSQRKIANILIKNRWTRHQNVLHAKHCRDNIVTAVVQQQRGGIHPRPPTRKLHYSCKHNACRSLPK